MKGKFYTVGMLALALALGFVFTGCDTGTNDPTPPSTAYLNEKAWVCTSGVMPSGITSLTVEFSGTNQWKQTFNGTGSDAGKTVLGTYTVSGLTNTCTITGGTMTTNTPSMIGTTFTLTFNATQATQFTLEFGGNPYIFNRQP
jgi:pectin methylesterase-like acyl-CoA thioesterase